MLVVPVTFNLPSSNQQRYMATIITPLLHVTVCGLSHIDAINRCLKEFNQRTYYDLSYYEQNG